MNRVHLFEEHIAPHLDAATNLARWLLRDPRAAEDAVQDAALRALRYLSSLRVGESRAWWLGIVRNVCFDALARARSRRDDVEFDAAAFESMLAAPAEAMPDAQLRQARLRRHVDAAIAALSPPLREVLVLREFEELSYEEIARVAGVPIGTVMSRLSRARQRLRDALAACWQDE